MALNGQPNDHCRCSQKITDRVILNENDLPNIKPRCAWKFGSKPTESPHHHTTYPLKKPQILPTILDHVGNTPMVRMHTIPKQEGIEAEIYAKCEYFNPGGSVKDRIAIRIVEEAERDGTLKPGMTLIEASSGNTGIGLALVATIKGYKCIVTMPEKIAGEKADVLRLLGADIVRTPDNAPYDSPDSHVGVAIRLAKEIPGAILLNQYRNEYNPILHYDVTAEEIIEQTGGDFDVLVASSGTGGTISGIGRKVREKMGDRVKIVGIIGVDPTGEEKPDPVKIQKSGLFQVEGVQYYFLPTTTDRTIVNEYVRSSDSASFNMARRMIKYEGLLVGGSAGTAMEVALREAKKLKKGQKVVVILPDGIRNYMTHFITDQWMNARGFLDDQRRLFNDDPWWVDEKFSSMSLQRSSVLTPQTTIGVAINKMEEENIDKLPIVDAGEPTGVVTLGQLKNGIEFGKMNIDQAVSDVQYKRIHLFDPDAKLSQVSTKLNAGGHALAMANNEILGVVNKLDVLVFIRQEEIRRNEQLNGH